MRVSGCAHRGRQEDGLLQIASKKERHFRSESVARASIVGDRVDVPNRLTVMPAEVRMRPFQHAVCSAVLALIATPLAIGGGRLVDVTVSGPSLENNLLGIESERAVQVYLPPSYDRDPQRRYPTVYVLHGILDPHTVWTRFWEEEYPDFGTLQALMDAGIEERGFQEMILVIPDSDKVCHYTNSEVRGDWERFIAEDLIMFVDARYRTVDDASARGIAGHSMGGHGAIKLAMHHPDRFGVVYALNPSVLGWGGDLSPENLAIESISTIKELADLDDANFYVQALVGIGHCLAPNPDVPLLTDLPFGTVDGRLASIQPGFDRWESQMPINMVSGHVENLKRLRGLRFDSAFIDEFSHIPVTSQEFSRVLTEHRIEHTFEMYNGDHRNRLWGRGGRLYTELLPYFSDLLEP